MNIGGVNMGYRGWKPAGSRGWPVPRRGYGYGSIITSAQVKRQGANAENGINNSLVNNNTECNSKVMKEELKLSPSFNKGKVFAVTVGGIVVAFCHSIHSAYFLAKGYRNLIAQPSVGIVQVEVDFGEVFMA